METNKNKSAIPLTHLQEWMRWIITEPRGVERALKKSTSHEPLPRGLKQIVQAPPLNRHERLSIYAEAYFVRIVDALAKDFEATYCVLGQNEFPALMAEYLMKYPSTYFNISEIGRHLPTFIRLHDMVKKIPFLPDLVAFEWALIESFYANDMLPLNISKLKNMKADQWDSARIVLHPSVRFLELKFPVDKLWVKRRSKQVFAKFISSKLRSENINLLIHRTKDHQLAIERLSLGQWKILKNLQQEKTLSFALHAAPKYSNFIEKWFSEWMNSGIISDVKIITE